MSLDFSQGMANAPICAAEAIDACLTEQGFKKTGSEAVDGHPCAIYEGSVSAPGHPKAGLVRAAARAAGGGARPAKEAAAVSLTVMRSRKLRGRAPD